MGETFRCGIQPGCQIWLFPYLRRSMWLHIILKSLWWQCRSRAMILMQINEQSQRGYYMYWSLFGCTSVLEPWPLPAPSNRYLFGHVNIRLVFYCKAWKYEKNDMSFFPVIPLLPAAATDMINFLLWTVFGLGLVSLLHTMSCLSIKEINNVNKVRQGNTPGNIPG